MLPNASGDIRQPIVRPASHPANDAGLRTSVSTAKLRLLHARTWAGISAELFEMHGNDPVILTGATALIVLVAFTAGFVPARRASRLDPMRALRYE